MEIVSCTNLFSAARLCPSAIIIISHSAIQTTEEYPLHQFTRSSDNNRQRRANLSHLRAATTRWGGATEIIAHSRHHPEEELHRDQHKLTCGQSSVACSTLNYFHLSVSVPNCCSSGGSSRGRIHAKVVIQMLDMIRTLCVLFVYLLISLLCNLVKFNYSVCLSVWTPFCLFHYSQWHVLLLLLVSIKSIWWSRVADTAIYSSWDREIFRLIRVGTECMAHYVIVSTIKIITAITMLPRKESVSSWCEWNECSSDVLMCLVVTLTITAYWIRARACTLNTCFSLALGDQSVISRKCGNK